MNFRFVELWGIEWSTQKRCISILTILQHWQISSLVHHNVRGIFVSLDVRDVIFVVWTSQHWMVHYSWKAAVVWLKQLMTWDRGSSNVSKVNANVVFALFREPKVWHLRWIKILLDLILKIISISWVECDAFGLLRLFNSGDEFVGFDADSALVLAHWVVHTWVRVWAFQSGLVLLRANCSRAYLICAKARTICIVSSRDFLLVAERLKRFVLVLLKVDLLVLVLSW